MTSITMRLLDAKRVAVALTPHAAKDTFTPVLTHIGVGGALGNFAYASDRYSVGRYDLTNVVIGDMPEDILMIPATAFSAVKSLGRATLPNDHFLDNYHVRFERQESGKLTYMVISVLWHNDADNTDMVHWMRTWVITATTSYFPPLAKLFNEYEPGEKERLHLGAENLEKFSGYAKHIRSTMRVTFAKDKANNRHSPILIEIGNRFKGLLQPVLGHDTDTSYGSDLAAENRTAAAAAAIERAISESEATE